MTLWWLWVLVDLMVFHWVGIRLFSADAWSLISTRVPSLVHYVTFAMMVRFTLALTTLLVIGWTCHWSTIFLARTCASASRQLNIHGATYAWTFGILITAVPGLATWQSTWHNMTSAPSRHAFGVAGWLDDPGVNAWRKEPGILAAPPFTAEDVTRRMLGFRFNVVAETQPLPPDILLIVVESLRPELIQPSVMPNVHGRALQGLWMHHHHSGGNASSLGLFSLVSGLDAIWFYLADVRFSPAMNRLFKQAGYELGFFGGADDWAAFQMDSFIRSDAYDVFEVEPRDGLASDQHAIESTLAFLSDAGWPDDVSRSPRLAVLYLYATHAPFLVDPLQVRNLPSANADYPLPFGPASQRAVWNRYRNSARTLDAMIAPLLQNPQRLVAIVGDHGESFLDDGTIGHGTRLSAAQVQTPAILFGRKVAQREIGFKTSHADLLPTLISLAGIRVSDPEAFDGVDLSTNAPGPRMLAIADYLRPQALLIDSAIVDSNIFGVQCELNLRPPRVRDLGPKDARGNTTTSPTNFQSSRHVQRYFRQAFGKLVPSTTD